MNIIKAIRNRIIDYKVNKQLKKIYGNEDWYKNIHKR